MMNAKETLLKSLVTFTAAASQFIAPHLEEASDEFLDACGDHIDKEQTKDDYQGQSIVGDGPTELRPHFDRYARRVLEMIADSLEVKIDDSRYDPPAAHVQIRRFPFSRGTNKEALSAFSQWTGLIVSETHLGAIAAINPRTTEHTRGMKSIPDHLVTTWRFEPISKFDTYSVIIRFQLEAETIEELNFIGYLQPGDALQMPEWIARSEPDSWHLLGVELDILGPAHPEGPMAWKTIRAIPTWVAVELVGA